MEIGQHVLRIRAFSPNWLVFPLDIKRIKGRKQSVLPRRSKIKLLQLAGRYDDYNIL